MSSSDAGITPVGINDPQKKEVRDYDQRCRQKGTALREEN